MSVLHYFIAGSESTDSESILSPMSPRTSSSEEKENTRSWKDALEQFQYSKRYFNIKSQK